ncbi:MAG: NADH-quinone oxidoreductase subunit NuoG [Nitrospirota bacterium]
MIKLKIDDKEVSVPKGTVIIEAAKKVGIDIPHFCYHKMLKPVANCRICLVEIEKMPKLQTACSTMASDGMIVRTNTPKVIDARKGVMEFILANHPLDCPVCDQGGECHLQDIAHGYTEMAGRFGEVKHSFKKVNIGSFIEREMNRCIQCLRCVRYCDEVMDVRALAPINRGVDTEVATFYKKGLDCEFCGGCVRICPVGALTNKLSMYEFRPWQVKKTTTVCPYCGGGCQIILETQGDKILRVSSEWNEGRNKGNLCAKGYFGIEFVDSPKRLHKPVIREYKKMIDVSWEEVYGTIADRLLEIKDKHGGDAIAGIISTRCTNEDIYIFQRFFRGVIGTNNIDSTARYGYINAVRGLKDTIGTMRAAASLKDITDAPFIFLIGADLSETNPMIAINVRDAVKSNKAGLIIAHPFTTKLTKMATQHLPIHPDSEDTLIKGLIKVLFEKELYDREIFDRFNNSLKRLKELSEGLSYNEIEKKTGVDKERLIGFVRLFAEAERGVLIFGRDITEREGGYERVLSLIDILLISGKLKDDRWKISPISSKPNEQGAVEMGGLPEYLPGGIEYSDKAYKERLENIWDVKFSSLNGATMMEIFEKIKREEIKALYLIGDDPIGNLPLSAKVGEAIDKLDLLICQELFMTETAERADIILPACSFAEKDGSYTSIDGEILKFRSGIEPLEDCKRDWEIFSNISKKMGYSLEYGSAEEIYKDITDMTGAYNKKEIVDSMERYLSNGYIERIEKRYSSTDTKDIGSEEYPFRLIFGEVLYHSGKLSAYSKELMMIAPEGGIMMNPIDAQRIHLSDKERVLLKSPYGETEGYVNINSSIPQGLLFFPESFLHTSSLREIISLTLDEDTEVPYFKSVQVSAEKI